MEVIDNTEILNKLFEMLNRFYPEVQFSFKESKDVGYVLAKGNDSYIKVVKYVPKYINRRLKVYNEKEYMEMVRIWGEDVDRFYYKSMSRIGRRKNRVLITEAQLKYALASNGTLIEAANSLGVTKQTVYKYMKVYNLNKYNFDLSLPSGLKKSYYIKRPTKNFYNLSVEKYSKSRIESYVLQRLRNKMVRENILPLRCDVCGYDQLRPTDGDIAVVLDFKDGNINNTDTSNLRLICYNCSFNIKGRVVNRPAFLTLTSESAKEEQLKNENIEKIWKIINTDIPEDQKINMEEIEQAIDEQRKIISGYTNDIPEEDDDEFRKKWNRMNS